MRKLLLYSFLLIALAFSFGNNAMAQGVTTASINGVVTDSKGAIPGATVTITHQPTGTVYSTVSRADGRFNIPNLRVGGPYLFKVSFVGYKTFTVGDINLSIGQDQKISAKLEDNATALKEVTVSGVQNKVINSSRTGARETVNRAQIEALPTINRSLTDFTKLTPSASSNGLNIGGRSSTYNNITVDGALFNNSFGLSGTLGGQTSSQPISLDAIDQIQVDVAPYDVRQGNFTGAGINTVVKSGTNQVKGTVYDYIRTSGLQGYHAGTIDIAKTPSTYRQTGFSLGGPIIKNKLFFFVSGEQERISAAANSFVATAPGVSGANVSQATAANLDALTTALKKYGYDPGAYQNFNYDTYSDKATVKIDWNINKNNVLSAKYFYFKSYKDQPPSGTGANALFGATSRNASSVSLPFYGAGYRINNNFNIGIIELATKVSSNMSNKLTFGYSALRDYRASLGKGSTIPFVDIGNGTSDASGNVITAPSGVSTSFGYEVFTAGNLLSTNIWQFSDDFTIYAGKHEITIGTNDQLQKYTNGFAPNYNGLYSFNSASDFINGLPAAAYATRYSALSDGSFPFAKISASTFSAYVQDKYQVTDNFKLSYGLRADYNVYPTSLAANTPATLLTFQGGAHVDPSQLPKNRVALSPRVGFNWDVNGDQSTQVRGGSGLFSGGVPFVWISNQASNNGLLFGSYTVTKGAAGNTAAQNAQLLFNPDVNANRPAVGTAAANTSYELDIANPKLKNPKIWRTNLAVDQKLPGGIIGTIEAAYSKDINAIYHQNLVLSDGFTTLPEGQGQIRYIAKNTTPAAGSPQSINNPAITALYYMTNTNQGYSYFITGQLQKSFTSGFYANVAYTYTKSKDVNDGGSTASTIWGTRAVSGNPNADNLSNSNFVQPNRLIASFAYSHSFIKNTKSSFGLIFEAASNTTSGSFANGSGNGNVSYITGGDVNNDGAINDLMYVPKSSTDIILVPDFAGDTRTAAQQYAQLDAFIKQDPYLSKHRGQFTQRNAVTLPTFKRADFNFTQDIYVQSGKVKNTLRLSIDIINVGNLLNKNWGLYQTTVNPIGSGGLVTILNYKGLDGSGRPTYSFPYADKTNLIPLTNSYKTDTNLLSRWQAQIGLRYIFN
jgi:hypothetical protein